MSNYCEICEIIDISIKEEEKKRALQNEKWPKTVEEAVTMTLSSLPENDKEIIRNTPQKDLAKFHHTLGRWIRNNYGLYSMKNRELLKSCGLDKVKDADEIALFFDHASMVILEGIWKKLQ